MAFGWLIFAFVLFQTVTIFVVILLLWLDPNVSLSLHILSHLGEYLNHLLFANSFGQILFLGLGTWWVTRLVTPKSNRTEFLRIKVRSDTLLMIGLTVLLIVVMQPAIMLLSWLNAQIPIPESLRLTEEAQLEMLQQFLINDHVVLITLIHVALVPSIAEEILFRGYFLRMLEKSWGIWVSIIIGGLLFGLFHVRLTQLIPLAVIGIILGYVTWKSESLYPAIAGHLLNNGGAVVLASWYPEYAAAQMTAVEPPSVWLLIPGILFSAALIYIIHTRERYYERSG